MIDLHGIQALVFDVDGTLYCQGPVRRAMAWRLFRAYALRPRSGWPTLRGLRAYRHAQETLRAGARGDVAREQLALASRETGIPADRIERDVQQWMEQAPLDVVARSGRRDLVEILAAARAAGLKLGVFSDYPAARKLAALGVDRFFDTVVTAQDAAVQSFKPGPRGLEVTLARLGVEPAHAVYVGDRPAVDGEAARRAGMRFLIVDGATGFDELKATFGAMAGSLPRSTAPVLSV